jgi:hypothetical protein
MANKTLFRKEAAHITRGLIPVAGTVSKQERLEISGWVKGVCLANPPARILAKVFQESSPVI